MLTSDVLPVQTDAEDLENRDNVSSLSAAGKVVGEEAFLDTAAMAIYAMAKSGELSNAPKNPALAQTNHSRMRKRQAGRASQGRKNGIFGRRAD